MSNNQCPVIFDQLELLSNRVTGPFIVHRALNVLLNHRMFPSPDYNISALRYKQS